MISGVLASSSASLQTFRTKKFYKHKTSSFCSASLSSVGVQKLCSGDLQLQIVGFHGRKGSRTSRVNCNSGSGPGGPGFGNGDSKSVLDAFFLGKALAEAINERIESSVGEFLSTIGRLQAEQQKQVEEFQVDVLERAKKAKEKAAREAGEATGLVKPTAEYVPPVTVTNGVTPETSTTVALPPSLSEPAPSTTKNALDPFDKDTVIGEPTDD